uniref:Uncharacterized protein n=1 Tax=Melopsittacus undulatus TaxID=13146 RepID=A0A8V5H0T5_MELUD
MCLYVSLWSLCVSMCLYGLYVSLCVSMVSMCLYVSLWSLCVSMCLYGLYVSLWSLCVSMGLYGLYVSLCVGASLFASNIGSGHFVGLAGTGAAGGIAVGGFEWSGMFIVLLLGWVFGAEVLWGLYGVSMGLYGSLCVSMVSMVSMGLYVSLCVSMCLYVSLWSLWVSMVSMCLYGSLCVSMGLYGSLWVSMVSMCLYVSLCVPMCPYVSLCVPMCPYGSLWVSMCLYGLYGSLWVSMCLYVSLWVSMVSMCLYVSLCVSMCLYGSLWVSMCLYGSLWSLCVSMCLYGSLCVSMGLYGLYGSLWSLWVSMGLYGSLCVSMGLYVSLWISMGLYGLYGSLWVSMGLYVSLCVSMGLYGSLWVSMGPYGSLCVSMGLYVSLCVSMGLYGSLWVSMCLYVSLWSLCVSMVSMCLYGLYVSLCVSMVSMCLYVSLWSLCVSMVSMCLYGSLCVSMCLYVSLCVSMDMFSGALFIREALGWDLYPSVGALLAVTALYTVTGGLTALMYADLVQTLLIVGGASVLAGYALSAVGGLPGLRARYPLAAAHNVTAPCRLPRDDAFRLLRGPSADLPWPGLVLGLGVLAAWYWCTDQVIVQRCLAARSLAHVRAGCVLCGYLKVLPMFLMVLPGMAARVLFPEVVGCADPQSCLQACGSPSGCSNVAYPRLVLSLLPPGLRGLMLAVVLAALMSSLASIFSSAGTLFTLDIYKHLRPQAGPRHLLMVGRLWVLVLVGLSLAWLPVVEAARGGQLFDYIQAMGSYVAPPVAAVFVLAIFCPRVNEPGAFWGLLGGLAVGLSRLVPEVALGGGGSCGAVGGCPTWICGLHYLHFGALLFLLTAMGVMGVSWGYPPINRDHLHRLVFSLRHSREPRIDLDPIAMGSMSPQPHSNGSQLHQTQPPQPINGAHGGGPKLIPPLFPDVEGPIYGAMEPEDPVWKRVVNVNALILMAVAVFLWGYFA